jgi:hypothetical protein
MILVPEEFWLTILHSSSSQRRDQGSFLCGKAADGRKLWTTFRRPGSGKQQQIRLGWLEDMVLSWIAPAKEDEVIKHKRKG